MKAKSFTARLMLTVFLCTLLIGYFPQSALAAYKTDGLIPGKVYRVTASTLNMRSKPGTSGLVKARLPKNELVNYLDASGSWYKIRTRKGIVGYVKKTYVKYYKTIKPVSTPSATPSATPTAKPTATAAPSATPSVKPGQELDGLKPGKIYRVTASLLNLRSKASTKGLVRAKLPKNELVTYLGASGSWYKVRTRKGVIGYVQKQYVKYYKTLKPTSTPTAKPTLSPTFNLDGLKPGKIYRVNASLLNLRSRASTSGSIKAKLPQNELVTYLSASGSWYKVRTRKGVIGYAQKKYFSYHTTLQATPKPTAKPTPKPTPKPTAKPTVKPTPTPMDIVSITKQKYSYADMMTDLRALKNRYPDRVKVVTIGKTFWGEDIPAIRLGKPASRAILVDGSIHAREYMSTLLIMRQIEYYLARPNETYNGKKISSILDSCNIWFIPMVNPDGVFLSQNGVGSITNSTRKKELIRMNGGSTNFTKWKANGRGVDLNRNFSAGWYVDPKHKSPDSEGYGGTNPLSEKESKTLVNFLRNYPVRATINYHTRGNYMYWSYGQTGAQRSRDLKIAKKISSLTGYWLYKEAEAGSKSGGFMDYFIEEYRLPSFTLELGPTSQDAPQSIDKFSDIWRRNKHVPLLLAQNAP